MVLLHVKVVKNFSLVYSVRMEADFVSKILDQWKRERPDLDTSTMAIIGRISRLARFFEAQIEGNLAKSGLHGGRFDVLAALRRSGAPFSLSPTQLREQMMLSSGATTHRIDLLEKERLVERLNDPEDRRGVIVRLTESGKRLVDEVLDSHIMIEAELLKSLAQRQRYDLGVLLEGLSQGYGI